MAETRSQRLIQLNLLVLKALKERYPHVLDRDLTNKIDFLMLEFNQTERVEFLRAPEPVRVQAPPPSDDMEHRYENPSLLKFPSDQKHVPLTLRPSSPFEPKVPNIPSDPGTYTKSPILPPHRDRRANPPSESSPALPPRSNLNAGGQNIGYKPVSLIPSPEKPTYYNTPTQGQPPIKYKTLGSHENLNSNRPVKQVSEEPLPIRFREKPTNRAEYVNVLDPNTHNFPSPSAKKSGLLGEVKQTPFDTGRQSPYENCDEPKKNPPRREMSREGFIDMDEGLTIIDGERGPMEFQGLPMSRNIDTPPFQFRPPLPPPYHSQSSETEELTEDVLKFPGLKQTPELPPRASPNVSPTRNKNSYTNTNFGNNSKVAYVNMPELEKERSRIHFDNISNRPSRSASESNPEEWKGFGSPVRKEQDPLKTEDGYLVLHPNTDEESAPGTYEEISEQKGGATGVLNIRDLISEKTEQIVFDSGNSKRLVLTEKVSNKDESDFYELVSNKSTFFLYLTDHGVLTQEILSLSTALYMELHHILSPYYTFSFSKLKVTLGPAVGLLDTLSPTQKKNFFQAFMGKKEETLDIAKSLLQMKVTTSHIIYLSQPGSEFDEKAHEQYMLDRDQNTRDRFNRAFIPLIQGCQPLCKQKITNLIAYLGCIFKLTDIHRFIPDAYRHDIEMLTDVKTSLNLFQRSTPDEVIPQVIDLAESSSLRDSVYFRVKVNYKVIKKLNDTIFGISQRNIHLLSISNEEIEDCYLWSSTHIKQWSNDSGLKVQFKEGRPLVMSSPDNEKIIHELLKMRVVPKKMLAYKEIVNSY